MNKFLKYLLKPFFGKKFFQPFFEILYLVALKGMNFGYALVSNSGERAVLRKLKEFFKDKSKITVFDVGSNTGSYLFELLEVFADRAEIYAFEPVESNFARLQGKYGSGTGNVKLFKLALGEGEGEHEIFYAGNDPGQYSLYERKTEHLKTGFVPAGKIQVQTLDALAAKYGINHIDLLKLDVEGHELSVLKGAKQFLTDGKIDFIQFEFGGANIDSRTFFRDFFEILSPRYNLFRILQNGLRAVPEYSETDEIFFTANFLAARKGLKF